MGRKTVKGRPGKRIIAGKDFNLRKEIRYIQRRAAEHDGRIVAVGPLVLFSTERAMHGCLIPATDSRPE